MAQQLHVIKLLARHCPSFVVALTVMAVAFDVIAQEQLQRPGGANASYVVREFKGTNGHTIRFSLFVPAARRKEKLPLVLCLHGAGGNTAAANVLADPELQKKHPCVVIAPACDRRETRWVKAAFGRGQDAREVLPELMEALDSVIQESAIDPARVYVTGQSMGGIGTWGVIARHADRFAAAVPVCGIWPPDDAAKMNGVAIWAFHGDQDATVPVRGSREMIAALKAAGVQPEARYSELAGVGHGSWGPAYANAELWDWLFAQQRPAVSSK
jgi:predicted peptidase